MLKVTCEKGHIYNGEKFSRCPQCAKEQETAVGPKRTFNKVADRGSVTFTAEAYEINSESTIYRPRAFNIEEQDKTVYLEAALQNKQLDLTVGWLVCVDGEDYGKVFDLYSGINCLKLQEHSLICCDTYQRGEDVVCILVFDGLTRDFYLQRPIKGKEIFLNREPVHENCVLQSYDSISATGREFIFVPLCGKQFCWTKW